MEYGEVARKIARERGKERMSALTVGSTIGHNPVSIIIPYCRVVGSNGNLTGYANEIETKLNFILHSF